MRADDDGKADEEQDLAARGAIRKQELRGGGGKPRRGGKLTLPIASLLIRSGQHSNSGPNATSSARKLESQPCDLHGPVKEEHDSSNEEKTA